MRVMVVEDDDVMADLLALVAEGLCPGVRAQKATCLSEAFDLWRSSDQRPDAVICDWNLPDGSGLDFVREVRKTHAQLPLMVVTARSDRASVAAASRERISSYITKPFSIELVRDRLNAMLFAEGDQEKARDGNRSGFEASLERVTREGVTLSADVAITDIQELRQRVETLSIAELGDALAVYPALYARLISMANWQVFKRGSEPVTSMRGALQVLGVRLALDVALLSAIDTTSNLDDALLRARGELIREQSERIARTAVLLARQIDIDEDGCFAAGMLHKAGELCVLTVAQHYIGEHGRLDEATLNKALRQYSAPIAAKVKVQLRLPVGLKQMIGAIHGLPSGATHLRLVLMRLSALMADRQEHTPECQNLMRRLGVKENPLLPAD